MGSKFYSKIQILIKQNLKVYFLFKIERKMNFQNKIDNFNLSFKINSLFYSLKTQGHKNEIFK